MTGEKAIEKIEKIKKEIKYWDGGLKDMIERILMDEVTVNVKELYLLDQNKGLENGLAVKDEDDGYYDLIQKVPYQVVCMDGETCKVVNKTNEFVTLLNEDGEEEVLFKLSLDEFNRACTYNR